MNDYTTEEYQEAQAAGLSLNAYADARYFKATHAEAMEAGKAGLDLFTYADALRYGATHAEAMTMHLLADGGFYKLYRAGDIYFAGCRGPFTLEQAINHWNRDDDRAKLYTAALKGQK